ncbi:MAG TPA: hypothetical protein VFI22_11540, partial [Thermomicrobiales bacterium]|nr:hypothetical protein [Thermomicrobiales bacterium]
MDERRFHRFARLLAMGRPRASAAAGLPAAHAGSGLGRAAAGLVAGEPGDRDKDRRNDLARQQRRRIWSTGPDEGDGRTVDFDAGRDYGGACDIACGSGKSCCAGVCVDLQLNMHDCGACGVACDRGELCRRGF